MGTLEAFVTSVRLGSFSAAAAALNLTPGAISRQMAILEADLGVTLFHRHPQGIEPTAAGRLFHGKVEHVLPAIVEAAENLRSQPARQTVVKVSVTRSFGARWLVRKLPTFERLNPLIRVVPVADNHVTDLDSDDFDLAVRYAVSPAGNVRSERLLNEELCVVVAPGLTAGAGLTARRLTQMPLLHNFDYEDWRIWFAAEGSAASFTARGTVYNDYNLVVEAAKAGLGAAIGRIALVAEELASGHLVDPVGFKAPNPRSYFLVRSPRAPTAAARIFWDWLLATAAGIGHAAPAPGSGNVTGASIALQGAG